jgi:hypothetical protein
MSPWRTVRPRVAKVGDELRARDTGARDVVFPVEGSPQWLFVLISFVLGVALVISWVLAVPVLELVRRFR